MTKKQNIKAVCPRCGKEIAVDAWVSINSEVDHQAREKVLDGTLFDVKCASCQSTIHIVYPVLYSDLKHAAMVWLMTSADGMAGAAGAFRKALRQAGGNDNIRRRIVNDPNDFREKAIIFSHKLDDRVVEIAKVTYLNAARSKHPDEEIAKIYFSTDKKTGEWRFELYSASGKAFTAGFTKDLYEKTERLFLSKKDKLPEDEDFYIDRTWALSVFDTISEK